MIEYLDEEFNLHVIDGELSSVPESWVLVPDGAEVFIIFDNNIRDYCFYKENFSLGFDETEEDWWDAEINIQLIESRGGRIVWQRNKD